MFHPRSSRHLGAAGVRMRGEEYFTIPPVRPGVGLGLWTRPADPPGALGREQARQLPTLRSWTLATHPYANPEYVQTAEPSRLSRAPLCLTARELTCDATL